MLERPEGGFLPCHIRILTKDPSLALCPQATGREVVNRAGPGVLYIRGGWEQRGTRVAHPELDEEEGIRRPLLIELLQSTLFLRELVIDLTHIDRLQGWVREGGVRLADVHKQVFAVLWGGPSTGSGEHSSVQAQGSCTRTELPYGFQIPRP